MGESDTAMEYDQDLIFKHLYVDSLLFCALRHIINCCRCFYLDSPENARKYDMRVKSKHEADISKE
jgi:DNA ligase 4